MITDREKRLLRIAEAKISQAMIDRALDRLESEIRTKDASGHEHVGAGSPEGGQFGSGGGGGSSQGSGGGENASPEQPHGRKPRQGRKPGQTPKGISEAKAAKYGLTAKEALDRIRKGKPLKLKSEKAIRAQKFQSKTDASALRYTKQNEFEIAKRIGHGAEAKPDNDPTDIDLKVSGKLRGIEMKTMVSNTNDKPTIGKSAMALKDGWEDANHRQMEFLAVDHRDRFEGGKYGHLHSGHELYYRRGLGSYRIGGMYKVKDENELHELLKTPYDKLPKAAQGEIRGWKDDQRVARKRKA